MAKQVRGDKAHSCSKLKSMLRPDVLDGIRVVELATMAAAPAAAAILADLGADVIKVGR